MGRCRRVLHLHHKVRLYIVQRDLFCYRGHMKIPGNQVQIEQRCVPCALNDSCDARIVTVPSDM